MIIIIMIIIIIMMIIVVIIMLLLLLLIIIIIIVLGHGAVERLLGAVGLRLLQQVLLDMISCYHKSKITATKVRLQPHSVRLKGFG